MKNQKNNEPEKYILEGVFQEFEQKSHPGRIYREEDYLPHIEKLKEKKMTEDGKLPIDPTISVETALEDSTAKTITAEEQQRILKQIINGTKRSFFNRSKSKQMVSPNLAKKKKAKRKQQRQSRKTNRKK